jgi:hypothetical protein
MPSLHSAGPPTSPTTAARHGEGITVQIVVEPGSNDLLQIAGNKRDDLYPVGKDQFVHRPGNGSANKETDLVLHQSKGFLKR